MIKNDGIRRLLLLASLFAASIAGAAEVRPASSGAPESQIRVLFVGNSFTYFHNMPVVLEAISNSLSGPRVVTTMVASGGARLKDHWQEGDPALSAIRKGGWGYVVLQEQSGLGDVLIANQKRRLLRMPSK